MQSSNHLALYRKWRSRTFDEVYGQDQVTRVLKYETSTGQLSHAYLFCGSRGTGKTSCAKILAKAVNCLSPRDGNPCGECAACRAIDAGTTTDVLEMDAASNNGVDNIRDIRDEVNFAPSDLKYRVYIIDEVHMLSASAFNALLKTLEEPPTHVIFILATTELQKLPATIISRCQRFDFRRIRMEDLIARMEYVAGEEHIKLDRDAAQLLARLAQGGMRDALSLLELCSGGGVEVTVDRVNEAVGSVGREQVLATVRAVAAQDYDTLFGIIAEATAASKDLAVFWQELMSLYRDMLVVKTTSSAADYLDLTDTETVQLSEAAALFSREQLIAHCRLLEGALASMQRAGAVKRTVAELTLIKMSDRTLDTSSEALLARVARLEDMLSTLVAGGIPVGLADGAPVGVTGGAVENGAAKAASADGDAAIGDTAVGGVAVSPAVETGLFEPKTCAAPGASSDKQAVPAGKAPHDNGATTDSDTGRIGTEKTAARESGGQPVGGKRVLRAIRGWAEITQRIAREKQALAALLGDCRAYIPDGGGVIVRCPNVFVRNMIDQGDNKRVVREALAAELGRRLTENEVVFELVPRAGGNGPDETIFDELDEMNGITNSST